jgi:ribose transport system substrate-binding protein
MPVSLFHAAKEPKKMKPFFARAMSLGTLLCLSSLLAACSNQNNGTTPAAPTPAPPNASAPAESATTQTSILKLSLAEPPLPAAAVPSAPAKKPYKIGVSLLTRDDEFYKSLEQGLKDEAAKQKVDSGLTIASADKDLNKQINQVQNFIAQKVDAIVLCPVDSQGIASAVMAANQAHIPVFTADIAAKGGKVVAHIASDNVEGGRQDGEFLGKLLKGKGNIAILDLRTVTSVQDRVKGFKDALKAYPDIKIVEDQDVDGAKRENAVPKATNILTAHQDLNAIFGINDPVALGALSALQQLNKKDVVVIGFDAVPEAQIRIAAGSQLKADAIQWPHVIGGATIDAIVKSLNGETVPSIIPVATGLVTQDSFAKK